MVFMRWICLFGSNADRSYSATASRLMDVATVYIFAAMPGQSVSSLFTSAVREGDPRASECGTVLQGGV